MESFRAAPLMVGSFSQVRVKSIALSGQVVTAPAKNYPDYPEILLDHTRTEILEVALVHLAAPEGVHHPKLEVESVRNL